MTISPAHKAIAAYYAALQDVGKQGVTHEGGLRIAFGTLLDTLGKSAGWTLINEQTLSNRARPDGTLYDAFKIPRGYWEAKDTKDDLNAEIRAKIARGYPLTNTVFEDTRRAVLYQNGRAAMEADLTKKEELAALLNAFFNHTEAEIERFNAAVKEFQERIPELARGLMAQIEAEREAKNKRFLAAFEAFHTLCRAALNPNISATAIEEMLVQHLLTERLFRTVFRNQDFIRRNVIAAEIEKVIDALTSRTFSREDYLGKLDYFYRAIEEAAQGITDFSEKQGFLNNVYERFFQGFSKQQADTHGIVYTPQPIVDFMCASVEEVLQKEFGKSLSDAGVNILDPATGTGNFIVNILRRINRRDLARKYESELFCNEVMLLPYYIASLNIEHAYYELTGEYKPFDGLCFTDTLDLAEAKQLSFFSEENTERVQREKDAHITVIIGNPPYNVGQQNENDNNKNRKYPIIDKQVHDTYAKDSHASSTSKLNDPYVKFIRWSTDRLNGQDGIVCFITNNGFLNGIAFDGFRKNLVKDFTQIYHFDFKGNAHTSGPRRKAEGGNIFNDSIRAGVGVTLLIRNDGGVPANIHYHVVPDGYSGAQKQEYLRSFERIEDVPWSQMATDEHGHWLTEHLSKDFGHFLPLGTKEGKSSHKPLNETICDTFSLGVSTNRDDIVYDFNVSTLVSRIEQFSEGFNAELSRWLRSGKPKHIDEFLNGSKIKWSEGLKHRLRREKEISFDARKIRISLFRPFCQEALYYDGAVIERTRLFSHILPNDNCENENCFVCVPGLGDRKGFGCLMANRIPSLDLAFEKTQCFPFYTYDEDGSNRRENITDWALGQYRAKYGDGVSKWDIFHYVYGVLHSPQYRERYAENLKRELPRILMVETADAFRAFAETGARLADLHLHYETMPEYPLKWVENRETPFSWRVVKMRLAPDKSAVVVNPSLTLSGIPPEAFQYRLGNRSALEWVVDQYQVKTDARSGITSDPNRAEDPEYIARLVGRVVYVSVETARLVAALPPIVPLEAVTDE